MQIPPRILRAQTDDLPGGRLRQKPKDNEQQTRIIAAGTALMARHGRAALTMSSFAMAIRMAPITIRRHFPDLDSLLAEILFRHLQTIAFALGDLPQDVPDRKAARRAAYINATRTGFNAPTECHLLLMRDRHALPPDLAQPVEELRQGIGDMLAGANGEIALALLDTPNLQAPQVEAMLAALTPEVAATISPPAAQKTPAKTFIPEPENLDLASIFPIRADAFAPQIILNPNTRPQRHHTPQPQTPPH